MLIDGGLDAVNDSIERVLKRLINFGSEVLAVDAVNDSIERVLKHRSQAVNRLSVRGCSKRLDRASSETTRCAHARPTAQPDAVNDSIERVLKRLRCLRGDDAQADAVNDSIERVLKLVQSASDGSFSSDAVNDSIERVLKRLVRAVVFVHEERCSKRLDRASSETPASRSPTSAIVQDAVNDSIERVLKHQLAATETKEDKDAVNDSIERVLKLFRVRA